ncbi:hypothetical protein LBMAG53_07670 [Planctomycetota bacterium]|nr:hypothetical protein LBMAG53_07670 [Planctomycetota bacterium]
MFSFGQPKSIVGIDVGSYAVKAVALQVNKDRITLAGYAQGRIDKQDVADVIKKVIGQLGHRPRRVVTSVSGRSVIVRQVETPRLEGDELRKHITHEADKYIPFGAEEVVIDCQPLPDRPGAKGNNLQVMLVAVRKAFIQEHVAQLRAAGIAPEVIDVDVFALANAYELLGPPAPPETEKKATALIDIGASKSNIAIVQGSRVLFTREVYLAGNEISDVIARTFNEPVEDIDRIKLAPGDTLEALVDAALPAFEDLANEIRLSFDYVEGQFEVEVSTVVLTGGSSLLPTASSVLGNILGRPVHVFDPLAGLDLVPSRYDIHALDANSPALAVALGLAVHQLGFDKAGLGGQQSHAWQPRSHRDASAGTAVTLAPAVGPTPEVAQAETMAEPLPQEEEQQQYQQEPDEALGSVATQTPIQRWNTPAPEVLDEAGTSLGIAPPPRTGMSGAFSANSLRQEGGNESFVVEDDELPAPSAAPAARTATSDAVHRSGLLVVLDDDQEAPEGVVSERITGPIKKPTAILKIEGFEDENEGDRDEMKLPDLPKI